MRKPKGFTLIELMVVISIIALLISILVPALGRIRDTANRMKSSTQIRGIHQGLVTFAQGNGAQEYFAGLDSAGAELVDGGADIPWVDGATLGELSVEARLALLMGNDFYSADFLISPSERAPIASYDVTEDEATPTVAFSDDNYSYAMLQVDTTISRNAEWRNTINSQAPILSDRVIAQTGATFVPGTEADYSSLHSENNWRGNVAYNDGHVEFETTPLLTLTKMGDVETESDDLFEDASNTAATGEDAVLITNGTAFVAANFENSND